MRAVNALQEQDKLGQLEQEVAQTVAHVASTEKQVMFLTSLNVHYLSLRMP